MAHQSRLAGFIIDCQDLPADEGAGFWAAALGLQAQAARVEGAPSTPTCRVHRRA
jgi:hypothetical protein